MMDITFKLLNYVTQSLGSAKGCNRSDYPNQVAAGIEYTRTTSVREIWWEFDLWTKASGVEKIERPSFWWCD